MGSTRATGQSRTSPHARPEVAPAPAPADVGIVAAVPIEVGYLVDRLRKVRRYHSAATSVLEGEYGNKIVALATSGVGQARARRAAEILIAGHRPRWIISAGFAGALNPALARNDLVLPHEVIDHAGTRFPVEPPDSMAAGFPFHRGRLITLDRIVASALARRELHESSQADLVDMESFAVAALCQERLVKFLSLRVISDDSTSNLPPEVATLLSHTGSYRIGAALRAIWRRPSSLKDFWNLHEQALEAADRLAKFVARCLDDLAV
jgi:adenosylhomocysteine nucleosidase